MPGALQTAGAASEPSPFAALRTNRIITGYWPNRVALRDAAIQEVQERYNYGRQDSIWAGRNTEISAKMSLRRRPGTSIYNSQLFPAIKRFYSFNTFTTTTEVIRVIADTATTVYDVTGPNTKIAIFTKSAAAYGHPTFFLGVGNTLFMTNGVDNTQITYNPTTGVWGTALPWGIIGPTAPPVATQTPRGNAYGTWEPNQFFRPWIALAPSASTPYFQSVAIVDSNGWWQIVRDQPQSTTTGTTPPVFLDVVGDTVVDGTTTWVASGSAARQNNLNYAAGAIISVPFSIPAGTPNQMYVAISGGVSAAAPPAFTAALNNQIADGSGGLVWQNIGPTLSWANIGASTVIRKEDSSTIVDPNGYQQTIYQQGKSAAQPPAAWQTELAALTADGTFVQWQNTGPYSVGGTAPVIYGYAYMNSTNLDESNMSPQSNPITVISGNEVSVTGPGSTLPGIDTIVLFRTEQGGALFFYLTSLSNPPSGQSWTYIDNTPDSGLNLTIQAANAGQNTPLPAGAGPMAYHLGRIFVGVGNVIYASTGPDAILNTSNGNSGFNPSNTFTVQSKVTRLWDCAAGLIVFTVRDCYAILQNGNAVAGSMASLYVTTYISGIPLTNYDCFAVQLTTPVLFTSQNILGSLDPSAGIQNVGLPVSGDLEAFNVAESYVTYHAESTEEVAFYISNGNGMWLRMSAISAPETGLVWSPPAYLSYAASAVQSVEIAPGENRLLLGPPLTAGLPDGAALSPILFRDLTVNQDNGTPFPAYATFGSIQLATSSELAGLAYIAMDAANVGTPPALAVLLDEISGTFEPILRTRQDPPNLPPSKSYYSNRYSLLQNQSPTWCKHFQMEVSWPAENYANELYGYTIVGELWKEFRTQ
jgi:hypothetical protein